VTLKIWTRLGVLAVVTAALCALSLGFFRIHQIEAAVWPANAIVLAFMLTGFEGFRLRAMALGVAAAAMTATSFGFGLPPVASVGFALANAAEIAVAAWFLRRLAMPMLNPRDYLRFALGAVLAGPMAGAVLAAGAMVAAEGAPGVEILDFMVRWFRADALGMAVAAPFALTVGSGFRLPAGRPLVRGALAQALVLIFPICALLPIHSPFPFSVFIFPAVAVAVFVSRDIGGLLAVTTVAVVLIAGSALGLGPAARAVQVGADGMLMVQALLAALVATVHPLSAVLRRLDGYAAEAEERRRRAELASESKTRFLSVMSEELRSPLTGVLTVAELVKSGRMGALTPKQRQLMAHLVESGEQIDVLTRKLGDAAALQSGSRRLAGEQFNLSGLLVSAVSAARFRARRDCEIRLGLADDGLEVHADAPRLRQALIHVIVEASRYCGRSGLVQVSAIDTNDGRVRIQVEDDGDGVPVERMLELNSASAETSGFGVGLGLTRDQVRLQGGDLGIEAASLGGARVWIDLPAAPTVAKAA
jgi:signal transduction histidine kinase